MARFINSNRYAATQFAPRVTSPSGATDSAERRTPYQQALANLTFSPTSG